MKTHYNYWSKLPFGAGRYAVAVHVASRRWLSDVKRLRAMSIKYTFHIFWKLYRAFPRSVFLLIVFGLLISQAGCFFCHSVHDSIHDADLPYREFSKSILSEHPPLCRGAYVGRTNSDGIDFSHYQFTNMLAGRASRVLDIYVARDNTNSARFVDSYQTLPVVEPVFLFPAYMAGDYTPAQYFHNYYPNENPSMYVGCSMYFCIYGDTSTKLWLLVEDQKGGQIRWSKFVAQDGLSWIIRGHTKSGLGVLRYIYAVPLDIVTFPYQAFVWFKLGYL